MAKKLTNESTYIERLAHDGRGVGRVQEKVAFVFGALPGETATVEAQCVRKRYYEATATAISEPSPMRAQPPCKAYGTCGGCRLQHMSVVEQRRHKQAVVLEHFKHSAKIVVEPTAVMPMLEGASLGYRHKARLGVRFVPKKGGILIGFRERQSNKLTSLEECPVLSAKVSALLLPLRNCFNRLEAREHLSQIEVAVTEQQQALVLRHLVPLGTQDRAELVAFAKEYGVTWYLQSKGPETVVALVPDTQRDLYYDLPDFGLRYFFKPLDFTQINPVVNQKMVAQALAWLAPRSDQTVLDLFCGIGNFSLALARVYGTVIGVEGAKDLVDRAAANAAHNHLSNVTFLHKDLSRAACLSESGLSSVSAVLLDPPRSGAVEILADIAAFSPLHILYVSCNPMTLARDVGILVKDYGYQLEKIGIMDMFSHTEHIETMCLLTKVHSS